MLEDARRRLLKPGGRILPRRLRLVVAGVSSDDCRVLAGQWAAPPIPADYHWLDEYQRNTKHSRQFAAEEICTPPMLLGEVDLTQDNPDSFTFSASLTAPADTRLDGIAGWFECELAEGVWMTNSPLAGERIARNQIFLSARESFAVKAGEVAEVTLRCRKEGDMIGWTITPPGGAPRQKLSTFAAVVLSERDLVGSASGPLALGPLGKARRAVLALVDGQRTAQQIEQAIVEAHPALFPSTSEIRRFVRAELAASASSC
jgi:protein arginine N-methyltransferase 1